MKTGIKIRLFIIGSLLSITGLVSISILASLLFPESASGAEGIAQMVTPTGDRMAEPTLPASPAQADLGAVGYWLVCMVCHGDRGQGLTEEWRSASGPEDMNCWQSKCHAANHPTEGFELPRYAPRIIGQGSLARFTTAADLHTFISENMPWQAPGMLDDERYWQITAFLIRENDLNRGSEPLNGQNAQFVNLWEESAGKISTDASKQSSQIEMSGSTNDQVEKDWSSIANWPWYLGLAIFLIGVIVLAIRRASYHSSRNSEDPGASE